jgi:hypothetical protein
MSCSERRYALDSGETWGHRGEFRCQMERCGELWGKVADNGATGASE